MGFFSCKVHLFYVGFLARMARLYTTGFFFMLARY